MSYLTGKDVSQKDCIISPGKVDKSNGYIKKAHNRYAHRIAYEQTYGDIPQAHQIHHLCDNKTCINPEHLQAVTKAEHQIIHSHPKSAEYYANLTTCKYGHPLDLIVGARQQRACSTCHKARNKVYRQNPGVRERNIEVKQAWRARLRAEGRVPA